MARSSGQRRRLRLRLIHWDRREARGRAAGLRAAGFTVDHEPLDQAELRALKDRPPDAIVIDLSRLPSQGRDLALLLRRSKTTRRVPILFVDGDPGKVARVARLLPDATFVGWRGIRGALRGAVAAAPAEPFVPASNLEGYSGTPLVKKLGITPGAVVALVGAPAGFGRALGPLPAGVTLRTRARGEPDLILWFTRRKRDLDRGISRMAARAAQGAIWIAWPKRTSRLAADHTEKDVRRAGLDAGLVDYKICAIDADWSGLKFTRRKHRSGSRSGVDPV